MTNIMKIPPVGVKLFHTDGRTDMTKKIVAFRHFANAPEKRSELVHFSCKKSPANWEVNEFWMLQNSVRMIIVRSAMVL